MKKAGKDCFINDVFWCVDRKINLIVQSAASKCESWRDLSDKMTGLVGFFNYSQKTKDFTYCQIIENSRHQNFQTSSKLFNQMESEFHQLQSINELLPPIRIVAEKDVSQNLVNKLRGLKSPCYSKTL